MRKVLVFLILISMSSILLAVNSDEAKPFLNFYIEKMTEKIAPNAKTISKLITENAIKWVISGNEQYYDDVKTLIADYSGLEDVLTNDLVIILSDKTSGKSQMKKKISEKLTFLSTENGLKVYDLFPLRFNTAGKTTLTFLIANESDQIYEDIDIEVSKIESKNNKEALNHNDDYHEGFNLQPGEIGILQINISTELKTEPGEYELYYTLRFDDSEGISIESEECLVSIYLKGPNESLTTVGISPRKFYRGSEMTIDFHILNKSQTIYKDINMEIESIQRRIFADALTHNDDYEEGIELESNEMGYLKAIIDTDLEDPEGEYNLLYYFSFELENGDSYRTPLYHSIITVIPANDAIRCMDLQPEKINQNSKRMLSWFVKNFGDEKYIDINIESDSAELYYFGESLNHNDDFIEGIDLLPKLNTKLMTVIQTDEDSNLGKYALHYYFSFEDTKGNQFRSDDLFKSIEVIAPYEFIQCVAVSPEILSRKKDAILSFSLKNTGEKTLKDINIEINNLCREIYGESLSWNDDLEEGFSLKADEMKSATVRIMPDKADAPGRYVLRYSLFFEDKEGNQYESEEFYTFLTIE